MRASNGTLSLKFRLLILVIVSSFIVMLFSFYNIENSIVESNEVYSYIPRIYNYEKDFAIKTQGCTIPAMQPISETIQKYIFYPETIKPCPNAGFPLVLKNDSHIWINEDNKVLRHYNITNRKYMVCCYHAFYRPDSIANINSPYIDQRIVYENCKTFKDRIVVEDEFVTVKCFFKTKLFYADYFHFVPFKPLTDNEQKTNNVEIIKSAYNVLVIGIDNLSRLNFHRTMPKTAKFLNERGAVELMGYNKVGDNSFPNIVPLLMGYAEHEIKKICHPIKMTTFDDCPFLWHWYKEAGYHTAFAEDSAELGTFNYFQKGFRRNPTDYYFHPFITQAEKYAGKHKDYNAFLCMNTNYVYQILLDYIQKLTETLFNHKLFGFFWETTMSHDDLNYPMVMDNSYLEFFEKLESSNYLEKTVIILMSDHGIRWGPFRKTKQGYLEERLPLAYFLMPSSFRENYTEAFRNLEYNSRLLTTPFDVHETLLDLTDLDNVQNDKILERSKEINSKGDGKGGVSLFLKIPQNRTCKSAGITDHWCACHQRVEIWNTSKEAVNAAKHLISYLNLLLLPFPKCVELELDEIVSAVEVVADVETNLQENWREYSVVVKVKPSGALFEGTVRDDGSSWSVTGSVSRLNLYGKQSFCIDDSHLKLYCYCHD